MKIVAGGMNGLIGRPLAERLRRDGHELVFLRRQGSASANMAGRPVPWDAASQGEWAREIDGAGAVLNLAGEPIAARRWTRAQKERIEQSRIRSAAALVEAMSRASQKPQVYLQASAIGYYGARPGGQSFGETAASGQDFLAQVCARWEETARRAQALGVRTTLLRTGIVLDPRGGALAKMLPPFRFFAGGPLGDGRQVLSWIHIEDEVEAILFCLKNQALSGAVNLTAPNPVTMNVFAATLGRVMNRPSFFRVPGFALRLLLGEMADLLLTGQHIVPRKLLDNGFVFRHPHLAPALRNLLPNLN